MRVDITEESRKKGFFEESVDGPLSNGSVEPLGFGSLRLVAE